MRVNRKIAECAEELKLLSLSSPLEEITRLIKEGLKHLRTLRKMGQNTLAQVLAVRITRAEELKQHKAAELQEQEQKRKRNRSLSHGDR